MNVIRVYRSPFVVFTWLLWLLTIHWNEPLLETGCIIIWPPSLFTFISFSLLCWFVMQPNSLHKPCVTEMPIWEIFLRQTALIPMWLNLLFLGIRPKKTPVLNWADNDFCQRVKMPTHHIPTEFILPSILYIFYNLSYLYNVSSLGLFIHYLIEQKIQEQFSIHFKSQY